jgi:hypothetical protein
MTRVNMCERHAQNARSARAGVVGYYVKGYINGLGELNTGGDGNRSRCSRAGSEPC